MSWADEERARRAGVAIAQTAHSNPDTAARANAVARRLGLPADVVERNLQEIEQQDRTVEQASQVQSSPPKLQSWLSDPRNAASAGGDLPRMKAMAETTQPVTPEGPTPTFGNYVRGLWHSFVGGARQSVSGMAQQVLDFANEAPAGTPGGYSVRQGRDGPIISFTPQVKQQATQFARGINARAQADVQKTTPAFKTWWGRGIYGGVSSFTQQAPALAATLATGNPFFSLGQAGLQQETQAYAGYRANGTSPVKAMAGSLAQGAVEIGTEFLPLAHYVNAFTGAGKGFAKELGLSFVEEQIGEQAATHLEDALDTALTPNSTWKDYWANRPQAALDTAMATLTQSMIGAALPTAAHLARRRAETQVGATMMDQLMGDAEATKLRETDPEGFKNYVEHLTQNTPVENVYIPAEAIRGLHQDGIEDHPFWGRFADQIKEASALDGDVVIPFSEAATHLAGTEDWNALKGEARFSPGGMSQAELATREKSYAEQTASLKDRLTGEAEKAVAAAEPAVKVYQDVYDKLVAAGQTARVASRYATLWAAQREQWGNRLGTDAWAYHQANPIEFRNRDVQPVEGRALEHVTPEQALATNVPVELPKAPEFHEAVANTKGAEVTPDGLRMDLVRVQKPEQEGASSSRTGVFYLPKGSPDLRHYTANQSGYGGREKFEAPTVIRRPLFVKGATGGRAPEAAYAHLKGKAALKEMVDAAFKTFFAKGSEAERTQIAAFLEKFGGDPGAANEIISTSQGGNLRRYALQEHIIAHAVRDAGYDAVVGYSKGRGKRGHFISEVFDVREQTYPARGMESEVHPSFEQGQTNATNGRGRPGDGERAPLANAPKVDGRQFGPIGHIVSAAEDYARQAGIPFTRQSEYVKADPAFGKRVADAYAAMEHAPQDPAVKAAYEDLIRQSRAQYDTLTGAGVVFEFGAPEDPYFASGWNSLRDLRDNKHMLVFPTAAGFGSDASFDPADNPLLADTGLKWKDHEGNEQTVYANDLFRAVHDAFGHGIEGAGFRADGEENAWQAHARLFTGPALGALTSETRGQNSWLNFGPHGEANQTASVEDTHFADQKTGLMPSWTWEEGLAPTDRALDQAAVQALLEPDEVAALDPEGKGVIGWTPGRIDSLISAFGNGEAYAVRMSPDQFLGLTLSEAGRALVENRVDMPEYGGALDIEQLRAKGAPFLSVNMEGGFTAHTSEGDNKVPVSARVMMHDGRHRMTLLKRAGVESVPVIVLLNNKSEKTSAMTEPFQFGPQRSRSDQLATGDTPAKVKGAVPLNEANRERLQAEFGQGRVLFQAQPFYSALERAAEGISAARAPAQQWLATLKKAPGVKDEELEWTGILDWLGMQQGPVEKDAVLQVIRDGGIKVEESLLGDPGNIMLPEAGDMGYDIELKDDESGWNIVDLDGEVVADFDTHDAAEHWIRQEAQDREDMHIGGTKFSSWSSDPNSDTYRELLMTLPLGEGGNPKRAPSTHWDEQAVVAHTRFMDKTGPNGEHVLFVEEVQSDWHQKGREKGYQADHGDLAAAQEAYNKANEAWSVAGQQIVETARDLDLLPDASMRRPFDELGLHDQWRVASDALTRAHGNQELHIKVRERIGEARTAWEDAKLRKAEASQELNAVQSGIPDAPFKSSWPALVMKRLIHWAATNGYNQVAWTTGEQQAERYNLSSAVGEISASKNGEGEYRVRLTNGRAEDVIVEQKLANLASDGAMLMTAEQMKEAFGENVASQIVEKADANWENEKPFREAADAAMAAYDAALLADINGVGDPDELWAAREAAQNAAHAAGDAIPRKFVKLSGEDLRVGGEGMKAFYDRNLVNITNKIIKKYGAKVEETPVPASNVRGYELNLESAQRKYDEERRIYGSDAAVTYATRDKLDIARAAYEAAKREPHPGFTITPELRDAASEGFALFQGGNQPRGRVSGGLISGVSGPTIIDLFANSDLSTIIHETGHVWAEELRRNASDPKAPQDVKGDWRAVVDWWQGQGHSLDPDGSIPTEAHELFARGFERYVMEGKSPSSALRRAFDAFRSWLLTIYKHVDNLRSPISPDVRRVFDRMLATQEEIDAASDSQGIEARFKNAAEAGMTSAEFAAYRQLADDARTEAFDALLYRTMAGIRRERTKAFNEEKRRVRDQVTEEVNATPVFRAVHLLRTGRFLDDPEREAMPMRLDEAWLKETFGEDVLDSLPRGVPPIYKTEGDDADSIAELAGFPTGKDMVQALIAMEAEQRAAKEAGDKRPARARAIADETDRRMTEKHGDPLNDGSIEDEALAAVHNERQGELIASEARQLAKQTKRQPTPLARIREWAAEKIAAGRVVDVASKSALQRYGRAEAKAAHAFTDALARGDKDEAFRQSEIRLINHALIVEAKKAADFVEGAVDRLGKIAKTKTRKSIAQDYLDRAHALLEKFEFRPRSQRLLNEIESFGEYAERKRAEGVDVAVPPRLEGDGVHYTRMTVQELHGLNDAVVQLVHLGRKKQRLLDDKDQRDYQEARDLMIATARHNVRLRVPDPNIETKRIRLRKRIVGAHAAFTKMGRMIDVLDGQDVRGPFNRYIWRPLADAHHRFNDIMEKVQSEWRASLDAVPTEIKKRFAERVSIPEMPGSGGDITWSRMQLHQMARNAGNVENWRILCEGRGWDQDAAFAALDREMSAEEWAYIQRDLDTVGSFWPEIEALYKRVNGIAPPKVEARPIETSHGTFPGGYYPLVIDRTANPKLEAAIRSDELFNTLFTRATTRNGFINERSGATYVVSLTPGVSQRHVTEVVHDFTHREALMQADRFLSDPQVVTAMRETIGIEMQQQFRPWLKFIANQWASDQTGNQLLENIANKARTNMSIMGMGFRLSTMLTQVGGYGNSLEALGTDAEKWALSGVRSIAGMGWPKAYQFAAERSGVLRHRLQNVDRTQEQELAKLEGKTGLIADVRRFAFYGVGIMDHIVVLPTWHAGYNKAIADGMEEDDAVAYADKIVENSQGGAGALNTSAVQRTKGMASLLVMFYSYGAAYYNRQAQLARDIGTTVRTRKTSNLPRLMARTFWLLFESNIIVGMIHAMLSGGPPDDESYAAYILKDAFGGLFTGLPLVGGAVQSLVTGFDFQASPLDRAVTTGTHFLQDLWHEADDHLPEWMPGADPYGETNPSKKAVKNAVETAGYVAGLPLGQASNAVQFTTDWANGTQDPQSVGDWLKGLQRGKLEKQ